MTSVSWISVMIVLAGLAFADEAKKVKWDFEDAAEGRLPKGWTSAKTGAGEGSVWKILTDSTAPGGSNVLAQTAESPSALFNVCVANEFSFQDLEITVSFKAVKGKKDQGGGVVWRYIDANNYYITRMNPLEDNFRLYKIVGGKRTQLATKEELKVPVGEWHTLTVKMNRATIECLLDGKKELAAQDDTFTKPGKIGLWTKADAQTYFKNLIVAGR